MTAAALMSAAPAGAQLLGGVTPDALQFDDVFSGLSFDLAHPGAITAGCPFVAYTYRDKNSGFLDANALYAIGDIPLDTAEGVTLRIEGDFPKTRYFSLQSYEGAKVGNLVDSLPDSLILPTIGGVLSNNLAAQPDSGGSTYKYVIKLKYAAPPATVAEREPNTLYVGASAAKSSPTRVAKLVGYRTYLSDVGANPYGDKPLPTIYYSGPGGDINLNNTPDQKKCDRNNAAAGAFRSFTAIAPGKNVKFVPVTSSRSGVTFGNGDVYFMRASVSQTYGKLIVIRTKRFVTPGLGLPDPVQTRYWSMCQYTASTTAVISCLADRDLVTQADGQQIIVLSRANARPAAAVAARGYNWAEYGSGQDEIIGLRQLLPDPAFSGNYALAVNSPNSPLTDTLGDYAPDISYCDPGTFAAYADSGAKAVFDACRTATQH